MNWLKLLKEDKRAIFNAASYALQTAEWVRNQVEPEVEPENPTLATERQLDDAITY